MITVKLDGIADITRAFTNLSRKMPDKVARVTNYVGRDVRHALEDDIKRLFNTPTPYTQKAIRSTTATPSRLYSDVGFKNQQEDVLNKHYMVPHVFGGTRDLKRFEWRLRQKGILPSGMYVMPGKAAKIDRYGNWSRGEINQVLSALQAQGDTYSNTDVVRTAKTRRGTRPMQRKRRVYWVGRPGNGRLPVGIWAIGEKYGKRKDRIRPVAIFVRQPRYRKRWEFFGHALSVTKESSARHMAELMTQDADARALVVRSR